jgi:hypothetical protein
MRVIRTHAFVHLIDTPARRARPDLLTKRTDRTLRLTKTLTRSILAMLTLINSAALSATLSGETFKAMYEGNVNWRRYVSVFVAVATLQFLVMWLLDKRGDQTPLKEGSRKFARFFSRWYGAAGSVSVYCSDLEWLEDPINARILERLQEKGRATRAQVFIRKANSKVVLKLLQSHVQIFLIPDEIRFRSRMSLRTNEDSAYLIIRTHSTEDANDGKVSIVRSTTDRYWCDLAEETMELCRRGRRLQLSADGQDVEVVP